MRLREFWHQGVLRRFPHLRRRLELANAYQHVFGAPLGQLVLRDLLREGGVLSVSLVAGDSHSSAFNDGKRALALHVLDRLRWSEGELAQLGQELTLEELTERESAVTPPEELLPQ